MKIYPSAIVRDHIATLRNADSGRLSLTDLTIFYVIPALAAIAAYILHFRVSNDAYSALITVFGVFVALLLNIEIAMFSIFQRKWDVPRDDKSARIQETEMEARRRLLEELNANISYLVLFSTISLSITLTQFIESWDCGIAPAVMVFLCLHFALTLLMVVKRAHALFQKEYREG